jgi:methionine synthase II (cobalamin-independent)
MTKVRAALSGTYPFSEKLIQKIFDYKYGRDTIEPVKELFKQEVSDLISHQILNKYPIVSTGNLGIKDLIRPFTQELDCLHSYENIGDLPITRWHYTNTFYRQPTLLGIFPFDSKALTEGKHPWVNTYGDLYSFVENYPARAIIPGPFSLVSLLNIGEVNNSSPHYSSMQKAILDAAEMIAHEISVFPSNIAEIQLDEPLFVWKSLPRHIYPILTQAYQKIRSKNPSKTLIINTYFEDVTPILSFLLNLPIDGIGIDFHSTNLVQISNFSFKDKIVQAGIIDSRNFIPTPEGKLNYSNKKFLVKMCEMIAEINPRELIITSNTGLEFLPKPIADSYVSLLAEIEGEMNK